MQVEADHDVPNSPWRAICANEARAFKTLPGIGINRHLVDAEEVSCSQVLLRQLHLPGVNNPLDVKSRPDKILDLMLFSYHQIKVDYPLEWLSKLSVERRRALNEQDTSRHLPCPGEPYPLGKDRWPFTQTRWRYPNANE